MVGVELPCSKCEQHVGMEKKTAVSTGRDTIMTVSHPWTKESLIIAALVRRLGGEVRLSDLELQENGGMIIFGDTDNPFFNSELQIVTNEDEGGQDVPDERPRTWTKRTSP